MKYKIFLAVLLFIAVCSVASDYWIPKFRPFGTSTTFTDSTNYVNLNKGWNIPNDSMRVGKDLYVGVKGGSIYLDTNRKGIINFNGFGMDIINGKTGGLISLYSGDGLEYWQNEGGLSSQIMTLSDTGGFVMLEGNISPTGGTQQIKIVSDTASDYDANNSITLNKQSSRLTTTALSTAALGSYSLTWSNSLITANSIVYAIVQTTLSTGTPIINKCSSGSGSSVINIYNASSTTAFNAAITINGFVINSP